MTPSNYYLLLLLTPDSNYYLDEKRKEKRDLSHQSHVATTHVWWRNHLNRATSNPHVIKGWARRPNHPQIPLLLNIYYLEGIFVILIKIKKQMYSFFCQFLSFQLMEGAFYI